MRTYSAILFLLIVNLGYLFSQNGLLKFDYIQAKQGLSQGHILDMLQDSEGYIWIGTYNGLNRYNGNNFDVYYADDNPPYSLIIDVAFSLFEDRDKNLWIGTWGVDVMDRETGKVEHIPACEGENSVSAGEVSAITQDMDGNMWFATQGGGLDKYYPQSGEFKHFKANIENPNSLKSNKINDLLMDGKWLWIATEDGGVSKMNIETQKIFTYQANPEKKGFILSDKISCLYKDSGGSIWIGDAEGNVMTYIENDQFKKLKFDPVESDLKNTRIRDIIEDWDKNLVIASNGAGLYRYNPQTGKSEVYKHIYDDPGSINSNETYSLLLDKSKTLFVGTFGRAISTTSPYNHKFKVVSVPKDEIKGADINAFTDCMVDSQGNLIAGTYNGFLVYDTTTWEYRHFLPGKTYEENKILTVEIGPDGTIWLGAVSGLHRYDKNYHKVRSYVFDQSLKDHSIYTVEFDHLQNLWVGLFTKGVTKISKRDWQSTSVKKLKHITYRQGDNENTVSGDQPWVIYFSSDSTLWIGNEGGLCKYNYQTNNFTRIVNPGTIKTMGIDSEGTMWLGTIGKGLYKYNPTTNKGKRYTVDDGLCHSFIYGLVVDKYDELWIGTESGMSRFNPTSETFRNYYTQDGLPDDHFDDKSETLLPDGRIYMGTNKGFVLFHPDDMRRDTTSYKIVLTSLQINNHKIEYYQNKKDTSDVKPINRLTEIQLEPWERNIEFEFAGLYFAATSKLEYAFMLQGYDNDWIYTSSGERSAKYTNLDGGSYVFKVKAKNADGIWNKNTLEIALKVVPPFYKSLGFKLAMLVLALIVFFVVFKWRISHETRKKQKLEKLVEMRTSEISEKNSLLKKTAEDLQELNELLAQRQQYIEEQSEELSAQRDKLIATNATKDKLFSVLAHDLKSPFNVIMGYSDMLINRYDGLDDNRRKQFLYSIKQSAHNTFNMLENLLQWSRSQSGSITFNPTVNKTHDLFLSSINEIEDFADKKDVILSVDDDSNDMDVFCDINLVGIILRNLLTNAIKFSQHGDRVFIKSSENTPSTVLISVIDRGTGMDKEIVNELFSVENTSSKQGTDGEKGTGLGLILCKDFVEYHKGKIWAESDSVQGTTFNFTLPKANKK